MSQGWLRCGAALQLACRVFLSRSASAQHLGFGTNFTITPGSSASEYLSVSI